MGEEGVGGMACSGRKTHVNNPGGNTLEVSLLGRLP